MTGTPELVTAVRSAKQYLTYVSAGPFQYAVAEAFALPESYFDAFRADHRRKRDLLGDGLRAAGSEAVAAQADRHVGGPGIVMRPVAAPDRLRPLPESGRLLGHGLDAFDTGQLVYDGLRPPR